ncbi:MAG TPA: hydantoinase/oxoprolinase family protein [Candidatus Limnocylindrales bacterium]|nr:hydantoinase/oxoprolinase family protein [Candidatus Limnocylindrales bacterium]
MGRREMYRICIDVGGTFTDCLVLDPDGSLRQFKAATTPADPSVGFLAALTKAAESDGRDLPAFLADVDLIIHGTTLATNTLINRNGARTGLVTTEGFRDIIEIRRGFKNVRTSMYNVFVPPYEPLVPRYLRLEARERVLYTGEVHTPLAEPDVTRAAERFEAHRIEAIAVGFLHSYANPTHERRAAELLRAALPGVYVTSSHEILPVWREYERFSTTVVSAYVGPVVARYLEALEERLASAGFRGTLLLMGSDGLVETVDYCIPRAVYLIGSGPAAAPAGARHVGAVVDAEDLLSVDMGGTSFDICMIRQGEIPTTTEAWVQDERVAIKMVDIQSGGAGGGSIAWIDQLGLLRVGPQSAGGEPGPACYGKGGTKPTVTDADLVLGYVPADYFLGGEIALDEAAARAAIGTVAGPLGLTVEDAAAAIFTTINSYMADQITEVATRRGHDVRDFTLVAGGGAGPVHAASIARLLHLPRVVVPPVAATFSAFGMFAMDVGRNYARSYIARASALDLDRVNALFSEMEAEALAAFAEFGVAAETVSFVRSADLRYLGQFHEVEVSVPAGRIDGAAIDATIANFHTRHEQLYTFNMPWQPVEFLTFRLRATTPKAPFELTRIERGDGDPSRALKRHRQAWWDGAWLETPVYDGARLRCGDRFAGPAIVEEATTSVVVPPGYEVEVDAFRNYVMTRRGRVETSEPSRLATALRGGAA